jgi:uncharacterized protein (AIM24 family)
LRSHLFDAATAEPAESWGVSQYRILRVVVDPANPVYARKGAMVAYQGDKVEFNHHGGTSGLGGMMKRAISSDNIPLMSMSSKGSSEIFLAHRAMNVFVLHLEGDAVVVNGHSLLAFESSLSYDLRMNSGTGMASGGLWSTHLQGHGRVALISDGPAMMLDTATPTYTDTDATLAWSADQNPQMVSSMNMKSMLRGGSGEAMQYYFHAHGWVAIQGSEPGVVR